MSVITRVLFTWNVWMVYLGWSVVGDCPLWADADSYWCMEEDGCVSTPHINEG